MAKKKPANTSSSSRKGGSKGKSKRTALDDSTTKEALEAAIERQKRLIEEGLEEDPYDKDELVETLLDVPNRKPLEDPGNEIMSNNKLVRFVIDKPVLYKRFISSLREGASLASAVFRCKFGHPALVRSWIRRGMDDAEEEKDTFYSRLFFDIAGANAERRAELEIQVGEDDPKFWLQQGPGKYLDDEWKPKPSLRGLPGTGPAVEHIAENENTLRIADKSELQPDEIEGEMLNRAPAEENDYQAALRIMRESNVAPDQQPEAWEKGLRIQAGEQLSEEELEVKDNDEDSPISLGSNEDILTEQYRQAQSSLPS